MWDGTDRPDAEIAPADKKIYALRGRHFHCRKYRLICASIMSKKLAEGIDVLVLDVKSGSGAFIQREEDSVMLAEVMVDTAKAYGKESCRADYGHGPATWKTCWPLERSDRSTKC